MLTDAQKDSARLHAGYPLLGAQSEMASLQWGEEAYYIFVNNQRLEFALSNLTPTTEARVTQDMLPALDMLRSDIYNVRDNSDTTKAAVWERNIKELDERKALYYLRRVELCGYLNIEAGPQLSGGALVFSDRARA